MWILATGLFGASGILVVLWLKSRVENERDRAISNARESLEIAERWKSELAAERAQFLDQMDRVSAENAILKVQRKDAIDALENSSCPGALRDALRLSLGVKLSEAHPTISASDELL